MKKQIFVSVPASSGNLGPGFDVLGLSLDLRNELRVKVLDIHTGNPVILVEGEGKDSVSLNRNNVIFKAMEFLSKKANKKLPQLELKCLNRIPLARGLGSSSAAYLSGLLAANALFGNKYSKEEILSFATELEGHPDNVSPALFGGIRVSGVFLGEVISYSLPIPDLTLVVAVPDFQLATSKARAVLPKMVPLKDAVQNLASVGLLSFVFKHDLKFLKLLLNDRLHEPYRAKLIPGFWKVKEAVLKSGAYAMTLSGAGPTLISFTPKENALRVASAMKKTFLKYRVKAQAFPIEIDRKGAVVR
ncbi:MAG: homoserine kinase [Elusimicrobiota bacterium]